MMGEYRRPWWLVVNKPAGLVTKIHEESVPGERIFIIRGEPLVQGLAWLTWGPVAALIAVTVMTTLAISLEVRAQSGIVQALIVAGFLILPALAWAGTAVILSRLSARHLQAERQSGLQECIIRLNHATGEFVFQSIPLAPEKKLVYKDIHQVRLTSLTEHPHNQATRLTLETNAGPVVLLNEALGTQTQKADLADEIQHALNSYIRASRVSSK
jgi:hypothetical protein